MGGKMRKAFSSLKWICLPFACSKFKAFSLQEWMTWLFVPRLLTRMYSVSWFFLLINIKQLAVIEDYVCVIRYTFIKRKVLNLARVNWILATLPSVLVVEFQVSTRIVRNWASYLKHADLILQLPVTATCELSIDWHTSSHLLFINNNIQFKNFLNQLSSAVS